MEVVEHRVSEATEHVYPWSLQKEHDISMAFLASLHSFFDSAE